MSALYNIVGDVASGQLQQGHEGRASKTRATVYGAWLGGASMCNSGF
jgi:hypothetical protein